MPRDFVNRNVVRIVGMARSGNHAIINWILAQLPGRWLFLNCVEPKTNPFRTARPTDTGRCYETNDPDFDLAAEQRGRLSTKDHLLFSQEDTFLTPALGGPTTAIQDAAVGAARRRCDVFILRDPYNLFASRRRLGYQMITDETAVRIWKQHARVFLGERRYLRAPTICISYNAWVRRRAYREAIAGALGISFTDAGLDRVALCGGGSSFDGYRFQRFAKHMAVFDRWRHYTDDPAFWRLFDPEVMRLAEQIFGPTPDEAWQESAGKIVPAIAYAGRTQ